MSIFDYVYHALGIMVVASPAALVLGLGLCAMFGAELSERSISRQTHVAVVIGLLPTLAILVLMLLTGRHYVPVEVGNWVSLEDEGFHFHLKFIFDRLSIPFLILVHVLCGVVGAFAKRYLHREEGYRRFFLLYSMFFMGMVWSALAGTIETLFFGWELVGLSSALLVAFFHQREEPFASPSYGKGVVGIGSPSFGKGVDGLGSPSYGPVANGLRVWTVYRLADAAFLLAALTMHHQTGQGDFGGLLVQGSWPEGHALLSPQHALTVGILLLIAAAGKSALVPFSGWLPRAMEGPTPSSAVFYGSLSVHLGAYLLLRVSPILDESWILQVSVLMVGLVTAVFATLMSRVQSDIKSSLAYASLTQVGIIVAEIGLGLRYLALVHLIGHACLRTLQLLRAPSLLHDYHTLQNAIGAHLEHRRPWWGVFLSDRAKQWWYRFSFERGYMDLLLDKWIVTPTLSLFLAADRCEHRWTQWLSRDATASARRTVVDSTTEREETE